MFIKTQEQSIKQSSEQEVTENDTKKLADALSLYLQSIKVNEAQPEWIYANSITLSAQINHFDIGIQLKEKAERLYPENDEVSRAIALLYEKQNKLENAFKFYHKSINLNPLQPEWVYAKIHGFYLQANLLEQAEEIRKKGRQYFPDSATFQANCLEKTVPLKEANSLSPSIEKALTTRATPEIIEHNVDLNVKEIRRQLMDSSIVEQYEILLEQTICQSDGNSKQINPDALVHCLAQIKTDIHYLKTKLFDPPAAAVDPQAKQSVDIEKIVDSSQPIPLKCELKNRIVGSGWHAAEKHGRWTGPGTLSSIVLPYPAAGKYRLEIIVRSQAKSGLLKTLKINVNDRPLATSINQENISFPAVIQEEITIESKNQPFLSVDLIVNETVNPPSSDTRLVGLLIEQISLIPVS